MDNKEEVLSALEDFSRKPDEAVPSILNDYLLRIASTGETIFPWLKLRPLFLHKLEQVMEEFFKDVPTDSLPACPNIKMVKFQQMKENIITCINSFNGAPFTIQRLCELVTNPRNHYKRTDKFMRGIEKNVLVVSTVDPFGNKIVNESKIFVNGIDGAESNGVEGNIDDNCVAASPFLMPAAPPSSATNSPSSPPPHDTLGATGRAPLAMEEPFSPITSWPNTPTQPVGIESSPITPSRPSDTHREGESAAKRLRLSEEAMDDSEADAASPNQSEDPLLQEVLSGGSGDVNTNLPDTNSSEESSKPTSDTSDENTSNKQTEEVSQTDDVQPTPSAELDCAASSSSSTSLTSSSSSSSSASPSPESKQSDITSTDEEHISLPQPIVEPSPQVTSSDSKDSSESKDTEKDDSTSTQSLSKASDSIEVAMTTDITPEKSAAEATKKTDTTEEKPTESRGVSTSVAENTENECTISQSHDSDSKGDQSEDTKLISQNIDQSESNKHEEMVSGPIDNQGENSDDLPVCSSSTEHSETNMETD